MDNQIGKNVDLLFRPKNDIWNFELKPKLLTNFDLKKPNCDKFDS